MKPIFLLIIVLGIVLVLLPLTLSYSASIHAQASLPPNPTPILTANDAIAKSLSAFPRNKNPHGAIAHLVYLKDAIDFQGGVRNYDLPNPPATTPAWLVAVLGDKVHISDLGFSNDQQQIFPGIYHVWNAQTGQMIAFGTLNNSAQTYQRVASIVDRAIPISAATPVSMMTPSPFATPTVPALPSSR